MVNDEGRKIAPRHVDDYAIFQPLFAFWYTKIIYE